MASSGSFGRGEELVVPRKGEEESQRWMQAFEEAVEPLQLAVSLPEAWN